MRILIEGDGCPVIDECIKISNKFKIEKHKRYKELADYSEDNRYDVLKEKNMYGKKAIGIAVINNCLCA